MPAPDTRRRLRAVGSPAPESAPETTPEPVKVGDLVAFNSRVIAGLRIVGRLSVLACGWHPELVAALKAEAAPKARKPSPIRPYLRPVS